MLRYARLYAHFLRFSFSRAFEFRLDFCFRIVMDLVYYAVNLLFFTLLYRHTAMLGGWNQDQVYLFVCAFLFVDAVHMTVFANNMWWLPIYINRGDLDYYLVRPVSSLFFLSLREFAANSFVNLILASGLLLWAFLRYPEPFSLATLAAFAVLLVFGIALHYLVQVSFLIPVFWVHADRGLGQLYFEISKLYERPHQIFDGWVRLVLLTILPFGLMASVPAHALFTDDPGPLLGLSAGVTLALLAFVLLFWRLGLRSYSSASS